MNPLLYYLLQVIAASGILYLYYHIALRNKRFHQYNRFYLLAAMLLSILIPFFNIPLYFSAQEIHTSVVLRTLTAISATPVDEIMVAAPAQVAQPSHFNPVNLLYYVYILLGGLVLIKIMISLFRIRVITRNYPAEKIGDIHFVNTNEKGTPFSFFKWLFWHKDIPLDSANGQRIFRHECYHIREKHTVDLIFTELLTAVLWINPFFHLMKKELRAIHEFLADRFAVEETDKWDYAELLLMQTLQTKHSLVNPFFYNQVKRRIAMITNPKKTSHQYLRQLLVLPLAAVVVTLFAFQYKNTGTGIPKPVPSDTPITVVIDAGHGGNDPGAVAPDNKYDEAGLMLELAKTVQELAPSYHVKVIMTREDALFPGHVADKREGLKKRIEITNNTKADLFISLHLNSTGSKEYSETDSGIDAYISGKRNDEKGKVLASALLQELAAHYKTNTSSKTRENTGIWVLDENTCPAVVLECGYINNKKDIDIITDKSSREKMARSILQGIVNYKTQGSQASVTDPNDDHDILRRKLLNGASMMAYTSEKIVLIADSMTIHNEPTSVDADIYHSLVVIDGKVQPLHFLENYTVIGGVLEIWPQNDKEAIRLYGKDAAAGLIMIKGAEIIHTPPSVYYKGMFDKAEADQKRDDILFDKVEQPASFPGGETAWKEYLAANLNKKIPVANRAPDGKYTAVVQFIVDVYGNISDVKAISNNGYGMEQEAVRIIKASPRWQAAFQNGRQVKAYRQQAIAFEVGDVSAGQSSSIQLPEIVEVAYLPDAKTPVVSFASKQDAPVLTPGSLEWKRYFERNLNPNTALPLKEGAYKVYIKFTVDRSGNISETSILNYPGTAIAEECQAMIDHIQKVVPVKETIGAGKTEYFQPIIFQVIDPNKETPTITVADLRKASIYSLLKLNDKTDIVKFDFTIDVAADKDDIVRVTNTGSTFNNATVQLIKDAVPGRFIIIENVRVMENGIEKRSPSRAYEVVK